MGTDQEKKKIRKIKFKKRIKLNLFLFLLILPLIFEVFPNSGFNEDSLGNRLIDICFGDSQIQKDYVEFFNIGQGDSTLIKSGNSAALIDFGIQSDINKIYNNLLRRGIKSLELAVITHHHKDHMGDFLNFAENMKINRLIISDTSAEDSDNELYEKIIETVGKNGTEIIIPKAGKVFELGNAKLKVLRVNSNELEENNRSIVMMVNICGKNILFTGDSDVGVEQKLSENFNLDCDILKLGHHGSKNSSSAQFLKAASPKFAIASCGYDNLYNHPSDETIQRAKELGIEVLRTDLDRNIRIVFNDDNTYTVETERGKVYDDIR